MHDSLDHPGIELFLVIGILPQYAASRGGTEV